MKILFILFALFKLSPTTTKLIVTTSGVAVVDYFNAQSFTSGNAGGFNVWRVFIQSSPGNSYTNSINAFACNQDSSIFFNKYIMMDSLSHYDFPVVSTGKVGWVDGRRLKFSSFDKMPLASNQVTAALGFIPSSGGSVSAGYGLIEAGSVFKVDTSDIMYTTKAATALALKLNTSNFTWTNLSGKPSFAAVATSGDYNDLINKPSIPSSQVNSDWNSVSGLSQILNKPTLFSGAYADLTGKPSLFSGAFTDLTGKPTTISGYGITDAQSKLNGTGFVKATGTTISYDNSTYLTAEVDGSVSNEIQSLNLVGNALSISSGNSVNLPVATFTAISGGTGISISSGSIITNTAPDQVISLTAGNNDITITGTYPNFVITPYVPTTFTVTRAINSSSFQISTTRHADAVYNIGISCTASIGGDASGLVQLQYSIDGGTTWLNYPRIRNSNAVTLAVVLQSINNQEAVIVVQNIPANARLRFVPTQSGTTTITSILGFETY